MAIFRGVGGSGDSSDNSFLQEVTAQANAASASATAAANSATSALNTELTSASFNTSDGVLTLTKQDGDTVTADLDGRFLTSYTETDPVFTAHVASGITATNISNWNTAYNNHITAVDYSGSTLTLTQQDGGTLTTTINGALGSTLSHNGSTKIEAISSGVTITGDITVSGTVDGRDLAIDGTKLDGIEANATADQTDAEIKTAYENNADTNAFTDAEKTKLSGIEASADVTDTANVTAAGALMDSEVTNLAQVKAFDSSDYATAAQGSSADTAYSWGDHDAVGYLTSHQDISGKANLSGATFTGNVNIGIPPSGTQSLTVAGATALYGGASVTGDIAVTGTVDGVDLSALDNKYLRSDTTDTCAGFINFTHANGINVVNGVFVGGNIGVTGTVDGRNVSADGAIVDALADKVDDVYFNAQEAALYLGLASGYQNVGDYIVMNPTTVDCHRQIDVSLDMFYLTTNNTNDFRVRINLAVPTGQSAVSMGTVSNTSSPSYYEKKFQVSGNWTPHLSGGYSKIATDSSGTYPLYVGGFSWNPNIGKTTIRVSHYGIPTSNIPSDGATMYIHPFGWEPYNTIVTGKEKYFDAHASGTTQKYITIPNPCGVIQSTTYGTTVYVQAREDTTSDSVVISNMFAEIKDRSI